MRKALANPLATIRFSAKPFVQAAVADPQLGLTYVPFFDSNGESGAVVGIVATRTGRLLRLVDTGSPVDDLVPDAAHGRLFVVHIDHSTETLTAVSVLDARSGAPVRTTALPRYQGDESETVALDSRAGRFYLISDPDNVSALARLFLFDTATGALLRRVPLPGFGRPLIALSPGTGRIFTVNESGVLRMLDARSGAVLRVVHVGGVPVGLAVDPPTNHVFVSGDGIAMLDATTGALLHIAPGAGAGLVVAHAAGRVFVANGTTLNGVGVFDARTGTLLRQFPVPGDAQHLAPPEPYLSLERAGLVFVAGPPVIDRSGYPVGPAHLTVLRARDGQVIQTIALGRASGVPSLPYAVDEVHERAFLDNGNGTLRLVDISCL